MTEVDAIIGEFYSPPALELGKRCLVKKLLQEVRHGSAGLMQLNAVYLDEGRTEK